MPCLLVSIDLFSVLHVLENCSNIIDAEQYQNFEIFCILQANLKLLSYFTPFKSKVSHLLPCFLGYFGRRFTMSPQYAFSRKFFSLDSFDYYLDRISRSFVSFSYFDKFRFPSWHYMNFILYATKYNASLSKFFLLKRIIMDTLIRKDC